MASLNNWLSPDVMDALGWAILHSLWQCLGVAVLAAILMAFSRRPSMRYLIGVGALVLMVAAPVTTFFVLMKWETPVQTFLSSNLSARVSSGLPTSSSAFVPGAPASENESALAASSAVIVPAFETRSFSLPDNIPPTILPWLVGAWLCGVALFGLRCAGGFLLLEHRRRTQSFPAGPRIQTLCQEVQRQLGVNLAIRYLECGWLDAPAVIGWFRPIILLPACALTGLSEDQLRAVIAHELAHIRRLDAFVNLFQVLVETLLFYHPAMWWLNRRIRAERELCCDEIAVSLTGNRLDYARALTSLAAGRDAPVLAMAANRGPLSERILHVMGRKPAGAGQRIMGLTGGALFLIAALAAADAMFGITYPIPAALAKERVEENLKTALSIMGGQLVRQAPQAGEPAGKIAEPGQTDPGDAPDRAAQAQIELAQNSLAEQLAPPSPIPLTDLTVPAPVMVAAAAPPAEPPAPADAVDNVIVTAPRLRPEKALDNFIIAHAKAAPTIDKIARWRTGLCPVTIGLPDKLNRYVTERIVRVAMMAGAPLDTKESCQSNIIVLATPQPQALLDVVRVKRPALLGFHYKPQRERLATVRLPIQAWYSTAIEDAHGFLQVDLPGQDFASGFVPARDPTQGVNWWSGFRVSGDRTGDGLKGQFTTAMIVVDTSKIADEEIGPFSDYIAMLALSQGQYYNVCQDIPTITNLLAPNCGPEMKSAALTDIDINYLRGLYKMNVGTSYLGQRASIAFHMKKMLGGY